MVRGVGGESRAPLPRFEPPQWSFTMILKPSVVETTLQIPRYTPFDGSASVHAVNCMMPLNHRCFDGSAANGLNSSPFAGGGHGSEHPSYLRYAADSNSSMSTHAVPGAGHSPDASSLRTAITIWHPAFFVVMTESYTEPSGVPAARPSLPRSARTASLKLPLNVPFSAAGVSMSGTSLPRPNTKAHSGDAPPPEPSFAASGFTQSNGIWKPDITSTAGSVSFVPACTITFRSPVFWLST